MLGDTVQHIIKKSGDAWTRLTRKLQERDKRKPRGNWRTSSSKFGKILRMERSGLMTIKVSFYLSNKDFEMRTYYVLTHEDRDDLQSVTDYEMGDDEFWGVDG